MFKRLSKFKMHHQVLFSLLIGVGVITFWRGLWVLLDIYLFPGNIELSAWLSLIIGWLILYLTHAIIQTFNP